MSETSIQQSVVIGLMRRDPGDLTDTHKKALEKAFPGRNLEFKRIDSRNEHEHAQMCADLGVTCVILPGERPIVLKAMENGVTHLNIESGEPRKLLSVPASYEPFSIDTAPTPTASPDVSGASA